MQSVKGLVLTGYGLNCDYETDYSLKLAGAQSHRVHLNDLIRGKERLERYHILVFGGGFSWGDDHGAGVLLAAKMKFNLETQLEAFIQSGRLIIGICNGFQALVNLGLLPALNKNYKERRVALIANRSGNFTDAWVNLKVNLRSPCVFTNAISHLELPVRHGEGLFYASEEDMAALVKENQIVLQYADEKGNEAKGCWPLNPNGSLNDVAGICDPTGRIFGLMPHPEAFHHFTNHPDWTRKKEALARQGKDITDERGNGLQIFSNAVDFIRKEN
jgi:phosphoribosylformylglycinamidine synthase subunit PurQ / glutaminase